MNNDLGDAAHIHGPRRGAHRPIGSLAPDADRASPSILTWINIIQAGTKLDKN